MGELDRFFIRNLVSSEEFCKLYLFIGTKRHGVICNLLYSSPAYENITPSRYSMGLMLQSYIEKEVFDTHCADPECQKDLPLRVILTHDARGENVALKLRLFVSKHVWYERILTPFISENEKSEKLHFKRNIPVSLE